MNMCILLMILILSSFIIFTNTRKINRCVSISNDIDIYERTKNLTWEKASEYIDYISKNEQESKELKIKIAQLREFKGVK